MRDISAKLLETLPDTELAYKSADTVVEGPQAAHCPIEFLNSLESHGVPHTNLFLKSEHQLCCHAT